MDDWLRENGELIIVDGMSEDGTQHEVEALVKEGIAVRLLNNAQRTQAHGLNIGIKEAEGDIIVRADAHCVYPGGYVRKCVELLERTGAANVGGMMLPRGNDDGQEAVAWAFRHPLGVGDARWHLGNYEGYVDTVYLGTFRRELFDEIGMYDTRCRTNEDAELNLRILKAGKKIYLDSSLEVVYFPRESLRKLAKQYFLYGKGRAYTTRKHKKLTGWRQVVPVLLVVGLAASLIGGAAGLIVGEVFIRVALALMGMLLGGVAGFLIGSILGGARAVGLMGAFVGGFLGWIVGGVSEVIGWLPLLLLLPFVYAGVLFLTALLSWPEKKIKLKQRFLIACAWGIMHLSWGAGFIAGITGKGKTP